MKQINVIYASLDSLKNDLDLWALKLPPKRRDKFALINNDDAKLNFLGGALLLDIAAKSSNVCAYDVKYTTKGKPYVEDADFKFSISHSDGFACCSFGNVFSGCDIQLKRNINLKVAERFFSDKENNLLKTSSDYDNEFFKLWCRKESAFKLMGKNLCTVENSHKIIFKDFKVFEDVFMCVCTNETAFINIKEIKF